MYRNILILLVSLSLIMVTCAQEEDGESASTTTIASTTQIVTESTTAPSTASTTPTVSESTSTPATASTTPTVSESTSAPTTASTSQSVTEVTLSPQAALKCIQCNSNADPNCQWTMDASSAVSCQNQPTNGILLCYTQTLNNVVYRGCVSDRSTTLGICSDANKCITCSSSNGCNNKAEFTCIQCNSAANSICLNYPTTYEGTYCTNAIANATTAVCYEASYDNVYYRGCLVDAGQQLRQFCTNDTSNNCKTCTTSNCNVDVTNGAWQNMPSGFIIISALFLLKQSIQ